MEIIFSTDAFEDCNFWIKAGRKDLLKKIHRLLESIQKTPFEGVDKPEGL